MWESRSPPKIPSDLKMRKCRGYDHLCDHGRYHLKGQFKTGHGCLLSSNRSISLPMGGSPRLRCSILWIASRKKSDLSNLSKEKLKKKCAAFDISRWQTTIRSSLVEANNPLTTSMSSRRWQPKSWRAPCVKYYSYGVAPGLMPIWTPIISPEMTISTRRFF